MSFKVGIPKETQTGERRVAMSPEVAAKLNAAGVAVVMEKGAGAGAHFPDEAYESVEWVDSAAQVYTDADVILKVQPPNADEVGQLREGQIVIGYMQAHADAERVKSLRDNKVTALAMELVPRISRAQSMDALSSQANIAGYKAVLLGANLASQFFPMLTTAAGTIRPAKVVVVGAGVAGLQAIATAKRLGAMVEAYDVRSATKEQVQSLGAKFIDTGVSAEGSGGYARELTDDEKQQQRDVLAKHVAGATVVITTAAIPGRPAPKLIDEAMVKDMKPGAVIVDLAAESGGNCVLTKAGETVDHNGVLIHGPENVPSMLSVHASEMYARNLFNLLKLMIDDGELKPDWDDEVLAGSTLTRDGEIKHAPTKQAIEGGAA